MKSLAVILVLFTTLGVMAQKQEGHHYRKGEKMNLTPEQRATLQTKELTLTLDLSEAQQKQVMQLALEEAKYRQEKWEDIKTKREGDDAEKPTAEEHFEMKNAMLDRQIAYQQNMKKVLTEQQYETWKKMKKTKCSMFKNKMKNKKQGDAHCIEK